MSLAVVRSPACRVEFVFVAPCSHVYAANSCSPTHSLTHALITSSELLGRELEVDAANSGAAGAAMAARPVEGCWFCLSNPNADVELVASVGEESYLALDKGAITDLHALVLPVEHFASVLALPASTWAEMER